MKDVGGWACPDLLSGPGSYMTRLSDIDVALPHVRRFRAAVQAGGHIGVWPKRLGELFERVYTFEPDAENFACLCRNVEAANVFAARGVLGDKRGPVSLKRSAKSTGQHRVGTGEAGYPLFRIDDLGLTDLDAVFLDVEGYEIPALRGGEATIRRCRPVIMAEENKRAVEQGFEIGALEHWLSGIGYQLVARVREDLVFVPSQD